MRLRWLLLCALALGVPSTANADGYWMARFFSRTSEWGVPTTHPTAQWSVAQQSAADRAIARDVESWTRMAQARLTRALRRARPRADIGASIDCREALGKSTRTVSLFSPAWGRVVVQVDNLARQVEAGSADATRVELRALRTLRRAQTVVSDGIEAIRKACDEPTHFSFHGEPDILEFFDRRIGELGEACVRDTHDIGELDILEACVAIASEESWEFKDAHALNEIYPRAIPWRPDTGALASFSLP